MTKARNRGTGRGTTRAIVERQNQVAVLRDLGFTGKEISRLLYCPYKTIEHDIAVIKKAGKGIDPVGEDIRKRVVAGFFNQDQEIQRFIQYYTKQLKKGVREIKRASASYDFTTIVQALSGNEEAKKLIGPDGLVKIQEKHSTLMLNLKGLAALYNVRVNLGKATLGAFGYGAVKEKETRVMEREVHKAALVCFGEKLSTGQFEEAAKLFLEGKTVAVMPLGETDGAKNPAGK